MVDVGIRLSFFYPNFGIGALIVLFILQHVRTNVFPDRSNIIPFCRSFPPDKIREFSWLTFDYLPHVAFSF